MSPSQSDARPDDVHPGMAGRRQGVVVHGKKLNLCEEAERDGVDGGPEEKAPITSLRRTERTSEESGKTTTNAYVCEAVAGCGTAGAAGLEALPKKRRQERAKPV